LSKIVDPIIYLLSANASGILKITIPPIVSKEEVSLETSDSSRLLLIIRFKKVDMKGFHYQ
jgi:hypothetical protein